MSINYKKGSVLTIIALMLLSSNSSTSASPQFIPMQQIGEDSLGDGPNLGYDISSAYAASFNGLLMITVVYEKIGGWGLFSNTTLRNSNGDLHLIMVHSGVSMVDATSLEDDSLNTNDETYFSYQENWRVHTNLTEITFFVDWSDIGGEGPVDLVFWTGRPLDNPDKLPNTGHLRFDGVQTVDKIGYFDEFPISTTSVFENPSDRTTTIMDGAVTGTGGSSGILYIFISLVLIIFISGIIVYKSGNSKTQSNVPSKEKTMRTRIGKPKPKNVLCNSCGTINLNDSSYCMECGVFIAT